LRTEYGSFVESTLAELIIVGSEEMFLDTVVDHLDEEWLNSEVVLLEHI